MSDREPARPYPSIEQVEGERSPQQERHHRQRMCALGYRLFAANRWGGLGDGHVSARDPLHTDYFWILDWGVPFKAATVDHLVLVGPDGGTFDADLHPTGAVNTAGYNIHYPLLAARTDCISAAHTHTHFGTPWSANVRPFQAISQESCALVLQQSMFDDGEVEVLSIDGGKRIAAALGDDQLCILRNHGLLTVGQTVEEAVGWFLLAERAAEVHVKAPDALPISDSDAAIAAATLGLRATARSTFQWAVRSMLDDPEVG